MWGEVWLQTQLLIVGLLALVHLGPQLVGVLLAQYVSQHMWIGSFWYVDHEYEAHVYMMVSLSSMGCVAMFIW